VYRRIVAEAQAGSDRPYLTAVIKETLRLHPPAWLMLREVLRPVTYRGWSLDPGDYVMICPWLLHRDGRWWRQPESFDPDRWLDATSTPVAGTYLPFGSGPRACPGTRLAYAQLTEALSTFWSLTGIEMRDPDDMRETCGALLTPVNSRARFV
jgi:unspecific monooxygenase